MEIVRIKKKNKNIYEVSFKDNLKVNIYDDTIIKYNLLGKKVIDDKEYKEIISFNNNLDAYYYCISFINKKLRTKKELISKLKSLKYNNDNIDYAINRLTKEGYLNDLLYIKSYVNDKVLLSLDGPNKIKNDLVKL